MEYTTAEMQAIWQLTTLDRLTRAVEFQRVTEDLLFFLKPPGAYPSYVVALGILVDWVEQADKSHLTEYGLNWVEWAVNTAKEVLARHLQSESPEVFNSPEFRAGAERGYEDLIAGRVRPWAEVKKELGL